MTTEIWAVCFVLFGTLLAAVGALSLKIGSSRFSLSINGFLRNSRVMAGILLYGISSVFFILGLRGGELSVLYPLVAVSYVLICFMSIKFLNERMNLYKWAGVALIIFGVSLIILGNVGW